MIELWCKAPVNTLVLCLFFYQSEGSLLFSPGAFNNISLAGNSCLLFPRITAVGGCWKPFEKYHSFLLSCAETGHRTGRCGTVRSSRVAAYEMYTAQSGLEASSAVNMAAMFPYYWMLLISTPIKARPPVRLCNNKVFYRASVCAANVAPKCDSLLLSEAPRTRVYTLFREGMDGEKILRLLLKVMHTQSSLFIKIQR